MPRFIPPLAGQEFMPFVYILKNKKDRYYTGITILGPSQRLKKHNRGNVYSTKFGTPWELIYIENFKTLEKARKREKQIKSWKGGNAFKKFLFKAAGSANGRPVDSGSANLGSNPSPAAL